MTTEPEDLAREIADGLIALAETVRTRPELAAQLRHQLITSGLSAMPQQYNDERPEAAEFIRSMKKATGRVIEFETDEQFRAPVAQFGVVRVKLLTYREQVCERIVVGTEKVTKKVKDPAALAAVPEIEVTEEVEQVEWRCHPILDGDPAPSVVA